MNSICIMGRITKDLTLSKTQTDKDFAKFNVAVSSDIKGADGEWKTNFIPCVAWGETAKRISKYFKKGSLIGITGSLEGRMFEKEDGTKQTIWEVLVRNFSFGDKEKSSDTKQDITPVDDDEDLPF